MSKIPLEYYRTEDVTGLGKSLLGKVICSHIDGHYCSGIISETEAYAGVNDKASHAYGGRRTGRTEIMYAEGGVSYVYLCYGIHFLLNIVSNKKDVPHAILIRGIIPKEGIESILKRRNKSQLNASLCKGPGKVSQALGIDKRHNGIALNGNEIWLEDRGIKVDEKNIIEGPRIGVDYAAEDALLPYRFVYNN